jgi:hypothetical protein
MSDVNSLISDVRGYLDRVAKLVELDAALLAIETRANLRSVFLSAGFLLGALAMGFIGLVILFFGAILFLVELGLAPSVSALLVAAALFVASAIFSVVGVRRLKGWSPIPHRTLAQFGCNLRALRASLRNEANG